MSVAQSLWAERLQWTFGDRIRKIRRSLDIPQGEFAAKLSETRESLSKWESGKVREPRNVVAIAKRIELAYGVPATWTLGLEEMTEPEDLRARRDSNPQPSDP